MEEPEEPTVGEDMVPNLGLRREFAGFRVKGALSRKVDRSRGPL
jgi:hypothetical protein